MLDLRLVNTDRNGANILARRTPEGWRLTPIDHAYCLPSSWQDVSFEWQWWPQAAQQFDVRTRDYIKRLDAEADLALLDDQGLHIRPECRRIFKASRLLGFLQSPLPCACPQQPIQSRGCPACRAHS